MTITKKQVISLLFISLLVVLLPLGILLTKKKQDIRPRALQGKANLQMNASTIKTAVGENIDVKLSMYLTDANLRISGADIVVLYDKDKLDPINVVPAVSDSGSPFTDAPIVSSGGNFDNVYNFLRISEVARKANSDLPPKDGSPIVSLGMVTFKAKGEGQATIKYPDDNKYLEIVGISSNNPPVTQPPVTGGPTVPVVTDVNLVLEPSNQDIQNGSIIDYRLVAKFKNGSTTKKLGYFKTELSFPKENIQIPDSNPYVSTVDSGFRKIIRVDSNIVANPIGKITIELATDTPDNGPTTDKDLTLAKFKMKGIITAANQSISIGQTEMVQYVGSQATDLNIQTVNATFNVL